jgi:hypothetical protein
MNQVAMLFERARAVESDGERPAFREWAAAQPGEICALKDAGTADPIMGLLVVAGRLEGRGPAGGSLVRYLQLAALLPSESRLAQQILGRIRRLQEAGPAGVGGPQPTSPLAGPEPQHCRRCGAQLKPRARFCSRCRAGAGQG